MFDLDACWFADDFEMRAFVNVLKTIPSADVADQKMVEVGTIGLNVA